MNRDTKKIILHHSPPYYYYYCYNCKHYFGHHYDFIYGHRIRSPQQRLENQFPITPALLILHRFLTSEFSSKTNLFRNRQLKIIPIALSGIQLMKNGVRIITTNALFERKHPLPGVIILIHLPLVIPHQLPSYSSSAFQPT